MLGVEHIRRRRPAAPEVVLRRLLSLDYLLERPHTARERIGWSNAAFRIRAQASTALARERLHQARAAP